MSIAVNLNNDEKRIIISELRSSFLGHPPLAVHNKISGKLLTHVSNQYDEFYNAFLNALFNVAKGMNEHGLFNRVEMKLALDNKKMHNMNDWQIRSCKMWLDGDKIYNFMKPFFFDDSVDLLSLEELINNVIDKT